MHLSKPELIEEIEDDSISSECKQLEGHTMCSTYPSCKCQCHIPIFGQTAFHRCSNLSCRSTAINPTCVYGENCPWEGATCSTCGEGKYHHENQ